MAKTVHLLDRIRTYMDAGGIQPTPANYEFWYRYATRSDPDLTEAVDAVMRTMGRVSTRAMENIRRELYGARVEPDLAELLAKTQAQLGEMGSYVEHADADARTYSEALQAGREGMQADDGSGTQLLSEMISATSAMIEKTELLEKRLAASTGEISSLKQDLVVAQSESRTDTLTGLANRKAFQTYLAAQMARAEAEHRPLSVAFCDVDHFKSFNDEWGHRLGDEVLRLIGQSLEKLCHGNGYPARYGGEEFVIAFPARDLAGAHEIGEKVRDFIASRRVRAKGSGKEVGRITLSLGIAQMRAGEDMDDLIERADAALYHAKQTGRNRVAVETELEAEAA